MRPTRRRWRRCPLDPRPEVAPPRRLGNGSGAAASYPVPVRLDRFDSGDAFLRAAGPFLRAREAHHCLILGFARAAPEGGRLAGATALPGHRPRRPSSRARRVPDAARQLVPVRGRRPRRHGPHRRRSAGLAVQRRGRACRARRRLRPALVRRHRRSAPPHMRERLFRLTEAIPPRAARGSLRLAGPADADVIGGMAERVRGRGPWRDLRPGRRHPGGALALPVG